MEILKNESDYNMIDWWKKVVIENYANFEGRARRSEYWYFVLANILLYLSIVFLGVLLAFIPYIGFISSTFVILYVVLALGLFIPSLAVVVRRLHDTGKSGWFYLINFIPLGGIVLLVFLCQDSEPGSNKWGPNPKEEPLDDF